MIPYKKSITIFDSNDILYYDKKGSSFHINKYLQDERRKQFPYSNIPTHYQRIGLSKYNYTNQLFNFEQTYIRIMDDYIIEGFAVKDKNEALLINNVIPTFKRTGYKTREELEKMFQPPKDKNLYIMNFDGSFYNSDNPLLLLSEDTIVEWAKQKFSKQLNIYKVDTERNANLRYFDQYTLRWFEHSINNITIDNIPDNVQFTDDNILLIQTNGTEISIQIITIRFMKHDYYKVTILDLPVTKYTLEQLKFLTSKIFTNSEPKIPLHLNPGVSREEIQEAKKLVRTLKNK